jgi:hypothetical protein
MSRITTCPHCATRFHVEERITDKTLICPHCLGDMDNAGPGNQIRAADINTDVKRDLGVGGIILAVLIGLCALGIAIAFLTPKMGDNKSGDTSILLLAYSCAALAVLGSIAIIRWGISSIRGPLVVKVFGIAFMVLGTIVAIFIFFFFACASLWKPTWH